MNISFPQSGWWEKVPAIKELVSLLGYPSAVNWDLARQVGSALASGGEPAPDPQISDVVASVWHLAQSASEEHSQITSTSVIEPSFVDRAGFVDEAMRPFTVLFEGLATKMAPAGLPPEALGAIGKVASVMCGFEAGCLIGYLATTAWSDDDIAIPMTKLKTSFVTTNLSSASHDWTVENRDLLMWICLRNAIRDLVTPSWVEQYASAQVKEIVESLDFDPTHLELTLGGFDPSDPSRLQGILDRPDQLIRAAKTHEGLQPADRLETLVNLIHGYVTFVSAKAGNQLLGESATRMQEITVRRTAAAGDSLLDRILGVELNRRNTQAAVQFCEGVVDVDGIEVLNRIWSSDAMLPSKAELLNPAAWLARAN